MGKVDPKALVFHPSQQVALIDAATGALTVDEEHGHRRPGQDGPGVQGRERRRRHHGHAADQAASNYRPGGVGSTVQLDPKKTPAFWKAIRDGTLEPGKVGGMPGA